MPTVVTMEKMAKVQKDVFSCFTLRLIQVYNLTMGGQVLVTPGSLK